MFFILHGQYRLAIMPISFIWQRCLPLHLDQPLQYTCFIVKRLMIIIIKSLCKKHSSYCSFSEKKEFLLKIFVLLLISTAWLSKILWNHFSVINMPLSARCQTGRYSNAITIYQKSVFWAFGYLIPGVLNSHCLIIYIFICCQLSLLLYLQ